MIRIPILLLVFSGSLQAVDLDKLWRELGISVENDAIVYDDDAPLAHIRKAMLKG